MPVLRFSTALRALLDFRKILCKSDESRSCTIAKYEIIIFWSEDDEAYIAEVPELAGCMADGETYQDALKNAEIIISEWIETVKSLGREVPAPKKGKFMYA